MLRRLFLLLALVAICGIALLAFAFSEARRMPVVRQADIALPGWPSRAPPIRVALISDIHIGSAAMDSARLDAVVTRINALDPDLVLIAGDFIFGHDPAGASRYASGLTAPLARLHPPLGTVAALGNHDHWTGAPAVRAALEKAGVRVLDNEAAAIGPLALGVVADDYTNRDDVPATLSAMARLPGAKLVLTHSPDIAPTLSPDIGLLVAGHTHCGQVVLPLTGAVTSVSRYGDRYRCGLVREGARTTIVTAGLGTSGVPFRFGAPPDLWLLRLGPPAR